MSTEADPKPLNSSPFIAAVDQLIPLTRAELKAAIDRGAHPDRIAELRQLLHCLVHESVIAALSLTKVGSLHVHMLPRRDE
ncbi:hypothetical protein NVS55_40270 (plasmid) [Myxococcus stipitatus]|uniref:hypothetical protein n=1 Tax=Myxococcus stipitatus TaxID=83455 RepID=UPI0031455880